MFGVALDWGLAAAWENLVAGVPAEKYPDRMNRMDGMRGAENSLWGSVSSPIILFVPFILSSLPALLESADDGGQVFSR
jgi:hypothetical protein